MILEALLALLLHVALCAILAFLAALLLRSRHGVLGYIGAGLFGELLGAWLLLAVGSPTWPGHVDLAGAHVHLLWTFIGALIVVAIFRYAPRATRRN